MRSDSGKEHIPGRAWRDLELVGSHSESLAGASASCFVQFLKIEYYIFEAPQFQQPHVTGVPFLTSTERTILESQELKGYKPGGVVNCQGLRPQRWQ